MGLRAAIARHRRRGAAASLLVVRDGRGHDRRRRHSAARLPAALGLAPDDPALIARDRLVLWSIRLPRIAMAVHGRRAARGGRHHHAGPVPQSAGRPGLVGVSRGRRARRRRHHRARRPHARRQPASRCRSRLPLAAFVGALVTTAILYRIATREAAPRSRRCCWPASRSARWRNAGIGLLVFIADDRQLRDITFWMLGSLERRDLGKVAAIAPFLARAAVAVPFIARGLDLMVLGEAEAFHMGVTVERLKRVCDRAGRRRCRRRGRGRRRHRLRRHRGAASAAAVHRTRPPCAAAGVAVLRRDPAARRRHLRAHAGGAGRNADRHRDGGDRRAVLSRRCCCGSARWSGYDAPASAIEAAGRVGARGRQDAARRVDARVRAGRMRRHRRAERRGQDRRCCALLSGELRAARRRGAAEGPRRRVLHAAHARASTAPCCRRTSPWRFRSRSPRSCAWARAIGAGRASMRWSTTRLREVDLAALRASASSRRCRAASSSARISRACWCSSPAAKPRTGPACCCSTSRPRASTCAISSICSTATRRCAARGVAVVAILHDLNLAALFADRIVVLHDGRVAGDGPPRETITDEMLAQRVQGRRRRRPRAAGRACRSCCRTP